METKRRLALMIDGDNAQAALLPQILAEVSKYGIPTIRRVYGDWTTPQLKSWKEVLHTYALKPEQQFGYTTGKNATDSALIIDAMDIIYTAGVEGLCIVSSDSDYTRLATRIREKNLFVMGIGRRATAPAFVNACDVFVYTENLQPATDTSPQTAVSTLPELALPVDAHRVDSSPQTAVPVPASAAPTVDKVKSKATMNRLRYLFQAALDSTMQDDGWALLAAVGSSLRQLDPGFDSRTYGHKRLLQLVEDLPGLLEVRKPKNESGSEVVSIRLKGK